MANVAHIASNVASGWRFHFDHVGTHIAEHLGPVRTENHGRDINNSNSVEWAWHVPL